MSKVPRLLLFFIFCFSNSSGQNILSFNTKSAVFQKRRLQLLTLRGHFKEHYAHQVSVGNETMISCSPDGYLHSWVSVLEEEHAVAWYINNPMGNL